MSTPPLPPAFVLLGPTASGKTAAVCALARRLPVEVISIDSGQVYRDMNIGTAKPDADALAACPHHLIDLISPEEAYSAARFRADALQLMRAISARGRVPLLAGGTMLYYKALRDGLSALPQADPALRREIEREAAAQGWPALHARLATLDPQAAARLEPNDAQRIQRALEIVRLTGGTLAAARAAGGDDALPFRLRVAALLPAQRDALHRRIAERFDAMLAAGLVAELVELRRRYRLTCELPSMRCVGYRQAWAHLEGAYDAAALREKGIAATRQLAKRQLTWLRAFPEAPAFDCLDPQVAAQLAGFFERGAASA
jgi:tRNA dimethylallyltransferase